MASMRDGLGGEEVTISGMQVGGTNISPYWTGSLTVEDQISGANIYSTADIVGESVYGDTVVSGALLKATAGSITNIGGVTSISGTTFREAARGNLHSTMLGSTYSMKVCAGSGILSSNTVWVDFPGSFSSFGAGSNIIVTTANYLYPDVGVSVSFIGTGSFLASGAVDGPFGWIAVGPA